MTAPLLMENGVTRRFLAEENGSSVASTLNALEKEGTFRSGVPLLNRPVFLNAADYRGVADDTAALHALLWELPDRLFDGDIARMATAVGMRPPEVRAIVRSQELPCFPIGRADFYRTSNGFKMLEFNSGGNIGGWDFGKILDRSLTDGSFQAFAAAEQLTYDDPRPAVVRALMPGLRDAPFVAIVGCPGGYDPSKPSFPTLVARFAEVGIEAAGCHLGQLEELNGRLYLAGRLVDVVHRMFSVADLIDDPAMPRLVDMLEAIAAAGKVRIFTPFMTDLISAKTCLALLSDDRNSAAFEPEQRQLINRIVPWTRALKPGNVLLDGEHVDLLKHLLAHRDHFVLKPAFALGGKGVVLGWNTSQDEWERLVQTALRTPHIVQKRVHPVWERFAATELGEENMILNWGVYSVGEMHGGIVLRGEPVSAPGVVAEAAGAKLGAVFYASEQSQSSQPSPGVNP